MIKETKAVLGGKERTMWFGANGFYDHIYKQTKQDPIEWIGSLTKREGKTYIDNIDDVAIIAYAGINSFEDGNDLVNTPYDKVRKWINGIDGDVLTSICNDAFAAFVTSMPAEGEAEAQTTANGTPLVGGN